MQSIIKIIIYKLIITITVMMIVLIIRITTVPGVRDSHMKGWGCSYLLGVKIKISNEHPQPFHYGSPPPPASHLDNMATLLHDNLPHVLVHSNWQVYGSHVGHKCELASNIASDAREEHRRASKKLGDIYDTISKAKKRVSETREHLLETQGYLKFKIKKHHGVLKTCLTRRELTLKADVESMTKARLDPIEAQEG